MATKYPIILVHGIMMKDFRFFHSFCSIEKVLKENRYKVYTAKIDGMGSISTNAEQLKEFCLKVLKKLMLIKLI